MRLLSMIDNGPAMLAYARHDMTGISLEDSTLAFIAR